VRRAAAWTILVAAAGCVGLRTQSLEGTWLGPWPLEGAKDCRTRIWQDGAFDLSCRDASAWSGAGTWVRRAEHLEFEFLVLREGDRDALQKPKVRLRLTPQGNRLDLGEEATGLVFRSTRGPIR